MSEGMPRHLRLIAQFLSALSANGFTDAELDRMSKGNPAALLGLPQ
jgi:predicted metal-dependent phosphotriesterase family hydrolase